MNKNKIANRLVINFLNEFKKPSNQLCQCQPNLVNIRGIHCTKINHVFHQLVRGAAVKRFNRAPYYQNEPHLLKDVYLESGAIADIPKWYRFGMLKVVANIIAFLFVGSFISKTAVTILEENDIFKPEDDDDDDDN